MKHKVSAVILTVVLCTAVLGGCTDYPQNTSSGDSEFSAVLTDTQQSCCHSNDEEKDCCKNKTESSLAHIPDCCGGE